MTTLNLDNNHTSNDCFVLALALKLAMPYQHNIHAMNVHTTLCLMQHNTATFELGQCHHQTLTHHTPCCCNISIHASRSM